MRPLFRTGSLVVLSAFLGGCVSAAGPRSVQPAIAQGALGSELAAMGLSPTAQQEALEAEYQALQFGAVGQSVAWQGDGFAGEVVPTQLYRVGSQDCRGYKHTVTRSGRTVSQVGSACRTGDVWTPIV